MNKKLVIASTCGVVLFFVAYLLASYFNYASELYIGGMLVCGIISIVAGISKKHLLWNILISLCMFALIMWGIISGMTSFTTLGLLLFIGLVMINLFLKKVLHRREK